MIYIWLSILEFLSYYLAWIILKMRKLNRNLISICGKKRLPIVDAYVIKLQGNPKKSHKYVANKIVKSLSYILKFKATESLIVALLNPKSQLRRKLT